MSKTKKVSFKVYLQTITLWKYLSVGSFIERLEQLVGESWWKSHYTFPLTQKIPQRTHGHSLRIKIASMCSLADGKLSTEGSEIGVEWGGEDGDISLLLNSLNSPFIEEGVWGKVHWVNFRWQLPLLSLPKIALLTVNLGVCFSKRMGRGKGKVWKRSRPGKRK